MSIKKCLFSLFTLFAALVASVILFSASAQAETIERVVAIVNDDVILLSDFKDSYSIASVSRTLISEEKFLDEMINKMLILQQARRFGFEGSLESKEVTDNLIVEKYLERRIKAFIHIPFSEVEDYYMENPALFKGKSFYDVQDGVESFLIDEKLSIKISEHIKDLRDNAYIRVQLR